VRRLGEEADQVMTCTSFNARFLVEEVGLDAGKVHLVYHGIDTARFEPRTVPALGAQAGCPRFVTVGRLVPKKGLDDVLRALIRLEGDFCFDVYGEGPERGRLEALSESLGLERKVVFHGAVTQDELVPALRAGGVFLCGSREMEDGNRDGIPNAVMEAMAVALPVVGTKVSGIPELVLDGVTGLLVEQRDSEAFATALERLVADPNEAERMGDAGRRRVEEEFDSRGCFGRCMEVLGGLTP